ncbi:MAG: hypothetical protein WDN49_25885 [Acetobacteraceae bacterium]
MPHLSEEIVAAHFAPLTSDDRKRILRNMTQTVSGSFSSLLEDASLPWQNMRELEALSLFELDHRVDAIEMRPERVTVSVGDQAVTRIPAFRLRSGTSVAVIDVLPDTRVADPERGALTGALKRAYAMRGIKYEVLRHADVRAEPRLRNARRVLRGRRYEPELETELAVISVLSFGSGHSVGSVVAAVPNHVNVREVVYSLAARHRVAIDLWAHRPEDMAVRLAPSGGRR